MNTEYYETIVLDFCMSPRHRHEIFSKLMERQGMDPEKAQELIANMSAEGKLCCDRTGCEATQDAWTYTAATPPDSRILFMLSREQKEGQQEYKADKDKPLAGYLLEFGHALQMLTLVSTRGAEKYGRGTWKRVERERYIDALMRHVLAMGPECYEFDTDSGLPHIVHVLWNAAAIIELRE